MQQYIYILQGGALLKIKVLDSDPGPGSYDDDLVELLFKNFTVETGLLHTENRWLNFSAKSRTQ